MNRKFRFFIPALLVAAAAPSLWADATMRLAGKVTTKEGKPVSGAKIAIRKIDTGWQREITTDAAGTYSQAGLAPDKDQNYEVTISKSGFATRTLRVAVPLQGSSITKDFHLYLPGQTPLDGDNIDVAPVASPAVDPALKEDTDARTVFNEAIPLYNEQKYAEALPSLQRAYLGITHAISAMQDETAKADSQALLPTIAKAYGLALHQTGKDDDAIAPLRQTVDADPKNAKNADAMLALVEIYKKKKDDANRAKYQGILNAATGTSGAAAPYSEAAKAFNAGHMKEARQFLLKAEEADASFADTYYLFGLVELNGGNVAGAKARFKKYLELAPSGNHAAEVKEMLASF